MMVFSQFAENKVSEHSISNFEFFFSDIKYIHIVV